MLLAQWPLSVVMQRRMQGTRWRQLRWSAVAVLPAGCDYAETLDARADPDTLLVLSPGLMLELHSDELDGYFENWAAPAPKIFVSWRMRTRPDGDHRAEAVQISASYAEGARMLDGGDGADGVDMPSVVHQWLGACLAQHRVPRPRRSHGGRS